MDYFKPGEIYYFLTNMEIFRVIFLEIRDNKKLCNSTKIDSRIFYFRNPNTGIIHTVKGYHEARCNFFNINDIKKEVVSRAYSSWSHQKMLCDIYLEYTSGRSLPASPQVECKHVSSLDEIQGLDSCKNSDRQELCFHASSGLHECQVLAKCDLLHKVVFTGSLINNECVECVSSNNQIKHMVFIDTSIDGDVFQLVGRNNTVERLEIIGTDLSQGDIRYLSNSMQLLHLKLEKCILPIDHAIQSNTILSVDYSFSNYIDEEIRKTICNCENLTGLYLSGGEVTNETVSMFVQQEGKLLNVDHCLNVSLPINHYEKCSFISLKGLHYTMSDIFLFTENYPRVSVKF